MGSETTDMLGPSFAGPQIANWPRKRVFGGFVGAYDDIPNIVALWSFRRCLSSYTGNLLRLRRSSDDVEQDFGYISNGDLDTDAISTFLGGATGTIVTLYDQSGNADSITQGTNGSQLLYVASGQNGHSIATADGVDDFIQGAFSAALSQPFTVLIVSRLNTASVSSATRKTLVDSDDGTNRMLIRDSNEKWDIRTNASLIGGKPHLRWNVWTSLFNGASSEFWVNKVSEAFGDAGSQNPDGITIGADLAGGNAWDGDIAEVVVIDASLSDADRDTAENASETYWGLDIPTLSDVPFGLADYSAGTVITTTDAINHPSVELADSTYYMTYNDSSGINIKSSSDGLSWTDHGQIIANADGPTVVVAGDLNHVGGDFYLYVMADDPREIKLWICTDPDPTDSANWSASANNPLITPTDIPGSNVVDPALMHFSTGFTSGSDGTHNYWMMVGSGTGGDDVDERMLFYADNLEGPWTAANGGTPAFAYGDPYDIYPGDFIQVDSTIWWLYSFRRANDEVVMRWAKSTDLVDWTKVVGDAIDVDDAALSSYVWAIEGDITVVGSELWVYVAMNKEKTGSKDDIFLVKFNDGGATEL